MKLSKEMKIEGVCSTDKLRCALAEPYLEIDNGAAHLIATNGRMLVALPVETGTNDASGYVSRDVLKAARKAGNKRDKAEISLNGVAEIAGGITMPREGVAKECKFPNWRQVVPNFEGKQTLSIGLDPAFLMAIANAIGSEGVSLTVELTGEKYHTGPIKVAPAGKFIVGHGAPTAVLMPLRLT